MRRKIVIVSCDRFDFYSSLTSKTVGVDFISAHLQRNRIYNVITLRLTTVEEQGEFAVLCSRLMQGHY